MRQLRAFLWVVLWCTPGHLFAAACSGAANCKVCSNCSRCAHCSAGGWCGVKGPRYVPPPAPPRYVPPAPVAREDTRPPGRVAPAPGYNAPRPTPLPLERPVAIVDPPPAYPMVNGQRVVSLLRDVEFPLPTKGKVAVKKGTKVRIGTVLEKERQLVLEYAGMKATVPRGWTSIDGFATPSP